MIPLSGAVYAGYIVIIKLQREEWSNNDGESDQLIHYKNMI